MKKAISYCRVSTQNQSKFGISLDEQISRNRRYAKVNNLRIENELREIKSGRKTTLLQDFIKSLTPTQRSGLNINRAVQKTKPPKKNIRPNSMMVLADFSM